MRDRGVAQILWPLGHEESNNAHTHGDQTLQTSEALEHLHRTQTGCSNKEQLLIIVALYLQLRVLGACN